VSELELTLLEVDRLLPMAIKDVEQAVEQFNRFPALAHRASDDEQQLKYIERMRAVVEGKMLRLRQLFEAWLKFKSEELVP
jgi:hypothetical protein